MIDNISVKDLKNIYASSKKFVMTHHNIVDPSVTVSWLDQNKIGYYDDGGYTESPLWDKAETKRFKNFGSAWNFAQSKYNNKNIVDCDLDIYIPLAYITYANFGVLGSVPTLMQLNEYHFATMHAYDPDLVIVEKEIVTKFEETYKFFYKKRFYFVE
tara:strand:+ start:54 stop:524 length:471 start_codon:yes stop_codon:yes gene_type:complete